MEGPQDSPRLEGSSGLPQTQPVPSWRDLYLRHGPTITSGGSNLAPPPELSPTRVSRRPLLEAMVDICRELQPGWRTFPKVMNELPISGGIQK